MIDSSDLPVPHAEPLLDSSARVERPADRAARTGRRGCADGDRIQSEEAGCWQHMDMSALPTLTTLETGRLILRRRSLDEAGIYRQLWTERDPRVPPHRRIDAEGRPTVEDIATGIRSEHEGSQPGILAVQRKSVGDVIGYCGLVFHDNGAPGEPELAYELLRRAHGFGYATEAGLSVIAWSTAAGYERLWATVRA